MVITTHGSDIFALRGRLCTWVKRFALHGAAAVAVNSTATEAAVHDIAPGLRDLRGVGVRITDMSTATDWYKEFPRRQLRAEPHARVPAVLPGAISSATSHSTG